MFEKCNWMDCKIFWLFRALDKRCNRLLASRELTKASKVSNKRGTQCFLVFLKFVLKIYIKSPSKTKWKNNSHSGKSIVVWWFEFSGFVLVHSMVLKVRSISSFFLGQRCFSDILLNLRLFDLFLSFLNILI